MAKASSVVAAVKAESDQKCGIVMPISGTGDYTEGHWSDVLDILTESIEATGLQANLVSNADDVGIIQKRIIQNLYDNPIVVCDVSAKNPNVMFELGIRLAFDKPTIIVKDDKTSYTFDTAPIEHLEYPRDLRFSKIVEFKKKLSEKIKATKQKAESDPHYTTFLKHFGEFTIAKIEQKEVSGQEFILDELRSLRVSMRRLERMQAPIRGANSSRYSGSAKEDEVDVCLVDRTDLDIQDLALRLGGLPYVDKVVREGRSDHEHLLIHLSPDTPANRKHLDDILSRHNMTYRPGKETTH